MAFYTKGNLKDNSPRSNGDTLVMQGQPPLTPQEYAMQNARYDVERGAQMERPTYGMWDGNTFVSTDPNEIAEMNARAEMRRTGLDRYYRPQSAPYFEAFNKIRDRYLQQELGKKAAVEAEGRAIVANRLGAFDKILAQKAEAQKQEPLNDWRRAQAAKALAEATAKGQPTTQKVEKQHRDVFEDAMFRHFAQWGDGLAKNLNELLTAQVNDGKGGKTTFQNTMIKGTNIPVSDMYNRGKSAFETAVSQGFNTGDALNIANTEMNRYTKGPTLKTPVATAVTASPVKITPEQEALVTQGKGRVVRNNKTGQVAFIPLASNVEKPQEIPVAKKEEEIPLELAEEQKTWDRHNREALGIPGLFLRGPIEAAKARAREKEYWKSQNAGLAALAESRR